MSVTALFNAASPDERSFLLAPPGSVEGALSPAALASAAVWTTRETGGLESLEALCPGGAYRARPGVLPGDAMNIDMSHLVRFLFGGEREGGKWRERGKMGDSGGRRRGGDGKDGQRELGLAARRRGASVP